ncbi:MAG: DUF2550 domain-containing protein [Propionibacteriaceae bacterium]
MDALVTAEIVVVALVVACMIAVVMLFARRRWLSSQASMFDCALRTPKTGWVLGVSRYQGARLQWFRIFSLSWNPKREFLQQQWAVISQRPATVAEQREIFANQHVLTIENKLTGEQLELAADPTSLMGLTSWIEARMPMVRYHH